MKAFFNRLAGKDKDKEPSSKEKFPPLRQWPPEEPQRPASVTAPSIASTAFKPLPELVPNQILGQLNARPLPPVEQTPSQGSSRSASQSVSNEDPSPLPPPQQPEPEQATPARVVRRNTRDSTKDTSMAAPASNDVQKKVAFLSPPPTPNNLDRPLPDPTTPTNASPPAPLRTTISRFQAAHGKEPRPHPPGGTPASSSKTDLPSSANKSSTKATSTRTASPYLQKSFDGASVPSLRSGTPYSSMSQNTSGSRILAASSWSEVTEGDLVSNIGSRERTRQEVLFEIIQSEDRYAIRALP
jgi:hypothetical protein